MTNEMIERVAMALCASYGDDNLDWRSFTPDAKAAIAAVQEEFADVIEYADNYDGDIAGAIRLKFSDALS